MSWEREMERLAKDRLNGRISDAKSSRTDKKGVWLLELSMNKPPSKLFFEVDLNDIYQYGAEIDILREMTIRMRISEGYGRAIAALAEESAGGPGVL